MEIIREYADLFLNGRPCREIMFVCSMSSRHHIAISEVKSGSLDDDLAGFLRHSLVFCIRQDSHGYLFRSKKRVLAERRCFGASSRASIIVTTHTTGVNGRHTYRGGSDKITHSIILSKAQYIVKAVSMKSDRIPFLVN